MSPCNRRDRKTSNPAGKQTNLRTNKQTETSKQTIKRTNTKNSTLILLTGIINSGSNYQHCNPCHASCCLMAFCTLLYFLSCDVSQTLLNFDFIYKVYSMMLERFSNLLEMPFYLLATSAKRRFGVIMMFLCIVAYVVIE